MESAIDVTNQGVLGPFDRSQFFKLALTGAKSLILIEVECESEFELYTSTTFHELQQPEVVGCFCIKGDLREKGLAGCFVFTN